jgi:hypothetical protein
MSSCFLRRLCATNRGNETNALKEHCQEKSVSNNHMGGYFSPSICAATTFKNFLIFPLKAKIFEKFKFAIEIDFLSLGPQYR